jgi:tetratricopeptide (TPR) repeat protein
LSNGAAERLQNPGSRVRRWPLALIVLSLPLTAWPQTVTTKVTVYNELFLTESGLVALPKNPLELSTALTIRSEQLAGELRLAADGAGSVYAAPSKGDSLYRIDALGGLAPRMLFQKGRPSELRGPAGIVFTDGQIIVYEPQLGRLVYMDLEGRSLRKRKIPEVESFAASRDGIIYLAPPVESGTSPLIQSLAANGPSIGFGKPLSFSHSLRLLNSRSLAVDENGSIYVAFKYLPIVRKYSPQGALISEFRIESPSLSLKENANLKAIGEGILNPAQRAFLKPVVLDIELCGGRLYFLSDYPRLEILELDGSGQVSTTFWMESRDLYFANDLAVQKTSQERVFYVARFTPPNSVIDVLKPKAGGLSDLDVEIQRWTTELSMYPDNAQAFINRGVARYKKGELNEALGDFSRAIELDPASAAAFNNRGLARVKLNDYLGATGDFSRSLELDPAAAATYFNRGIALIHENQFGKAIEDLTKASQLDSSFLLRAKEQIDLCRARMQKKQPD